jgi:hypothetical protein
LIKILLNEHELSLYPNRNSESHARTNGRENERTHDKTNLTQLSATTDLRDAPLESGTARVDVSDGGKTLPPQETMECENQSYFFLAKTFHTCSSPATMQNNPHPILAELGQGKCQSTSRCQSLITKERPSTGHRGRRCSSGPQPW